MAEDRDHTMSRIELLAVVILAVTAVLTAWSGFESSKWGGEMSIAFSRASSTRIEAAREAADATSDRQFDLTTFSAYVQARGAGDQAAVDFIEERFTDRFAVAFDAWQALDPLENPDAPASPFVMDDYVVAGEVAAADADQRADALFAEALENNARGDRYTLLTVLFALVLFFTSVAGRLESRRAVLVVQGIAVALLAVGIGFVLALPKII